MRNDTTKVSAEVHPQTDPDASEVAAFRIDVVDSDVVLADLEFRPTEPGMDHVGDAIGSALALIGNQSIVVVAKTIAAVNMIAKVSARAHVD